METSVIGYPRVGKDRELKFATEKYFRGEITEAQLRQVGAKIRKEQWKLMQEQKITYIPSGDFSFYDQTLDAAVLFSIIPERYEKLGLSELDTYFAMARGYQGEKGDVKALAMKKWFNTNYHYMVPELEDTTKIHLQGTKPFEEFQEALTLGILTKPVIVGPFTLLKLLRFTGRKTLQDVKDDLVQAYAAYLARFQELGAQWIQLDEPYLVRDLEQQDLALFEEIYKKLLEQKGNVKILLQTYFGDVRDVYEQVCALNFDGLGMDFVEGRKTAELIQSGFPAGRELFAGLVNGKNIWRADYGKILEQLQQLQEKNITTVLGTSCSLQHVPYTTESETKLPKDYLEHFAFAKEKLTELRELSEISVEEYAEDEHYILNKHLHENRPNVENDKVQQRVKSISQEDYVRTPAFEEREKIQKEEFHLTVFPTTTIGSFPQTKEVKKQRASFRRGETSREQYKDFIKKQIADCVKLQEELDLDVLVHGEYERGDMVEYFGEHLDGYLFTEKAWVQSYGTRCVKPPVIWGDISRAKPMTVSWSTYAQSLTKRPMKGMLTGPVTILNWSFPREDISIRESILQIALAIRDEVLDLETAGIRVIQVDEAALREKLPLRKSDWYSQYLDFAIPAFRLVHSGVTPQTQIHTHMCYSEFTDIIPAIDDMDADVITFEASRSDLQILDALKENNFRTEVGPGVYDIHSPRVPSVEELKETLKKILQRIPEEKVWVNPDCGLKTRNPEETIASLKNLVQAAKELRQERA